MDKNNRKKEITLQNNGALDVKESHYLRQFLSHGYDGKYLHTILINIPDTVQDKFDGEIVITNPDTNQKETIDVYFEPNASIFDNVNIKISTSTDIGITDVLVMIGCIIQVFIAFKTAYEGRSSKDEFNENILNSKSKYNTVYGTN